MGESFPRENHAVVACSKQTSRTRHIRWSVNFTDQLQNETFEECR